MPTHIKKQYSREKVDAYHREVIYLVNLVRHWPKDSIELQEFLEPTSNGTLDAPEEYADFVETLRSVQVAGVAVGLDQSFLAERKKKLLALYLYNNEGRRWYYARTINGRLKCASSEEVEPVSLVELEERYQHHLYRKNRKKQDLGLGPIFKTWRNTPDCRTFYDD